MRKQQLTVLCAVIIMFIAGCSKKQVPESSSNTSTSNTSTPTAAVKKPAVKKLPVPKVITVNDKAATKSFDGRLYYDVGGRRYWRNYNDGKYYLFNKNMYSDSAFIPH